MKRQSNNCDGRQQSVGAQKDKRVLVLFLLGGIAFCFSLVSVFLPPTSTPPNIYRYTGEGLVVTKESHPAESPDEIASGDVFAAEVTLPPQLSVLLNRPFSINRATQEELQLLPGVGPGLAEKIYTYRLHHGNFTSIEQLVMVPGIGTKTAANLQPLLTFSL